MDLVATSTRSDQVRLSPDVFAALDELRDFMFQSVYVQEGLRVEQEKAAACVKSLFTYYLEHPDEVPEEYHLAPGDLPTRIADYISGMTDRYALRVYEQLFLPQGWLM